MQCDIMLQGIDRYNMCKVSGYVTVSCFLGYHPYLMNYSSFCFSLLINK